MKLSIRVTIPLFLILIFFGCSATSEVAKEEKQTTYQWFNPDTVKAGRFDTGTMWTFEYPPLDYFKETYNFTPDKQWLENAQMAALRFATYCSASFVSGDGLVMTNDHCARESVTEVQVEGENLQETGFFAEKLEDERKVPSLFVDQLVLIRDVTDEILKSAEGVQGYEAQQSAMKSKITDIEVRVADSTGLEISVTALYNGAKYSLYGYKRYTDVRLVFSPETQLGYFGGDPDNFTYPRYDLDCSFFRVYDESGSPLKTDHYFKWSSNGASEGESIFVVGNPASTTRLNTVAQLEYARDIQYPRFLKVLEDLADIYTAKIATNPPDKDELQNTLYSYTNSLKAYKGILGGLQNAVLMAKKKDFEKKFRDGVLSDSRLNNEYGDLWTKIADGRNELRGFTSELFALNVNPLTSSEYFLVASDVIDLAEQLKLPEDQRPEDYRGAQLDSTVQNILPTEFDHWFQEMVLEKQIPRLYTLLGPDYPLLKKITGGKNGKEAAEYMLNNSFLTSQEKLLAQVKKGPDAILNSDDPFIYFMLNSQDRRDALMARSTEITSREAVYNNQLGKALYEVYGTSIAPDATFTLRISDGVVKGFSYNGTVAPTFTTFYGLYDRFYSFKKEAPFNLPERWVNPPAEFDLSTPFNFVSTNDIIGGNSGSAVINKDGEVVGLAFDGNIESLPGSFIFEPENNRMVSVHSAGMIEAIRDLYKATRLSDELTGGHLLTRKTE